MKSFTSLTAQDYQICITVIEARHLAGINMDPVVCVQVSGGGCGGVGVVVGGDGGGGGVVGDDGGGDGGGDDIMSQSMLCQ